MKKALIPISLIMIALSGCSDTRLMPGDFTDTYYYKVPESSTYFTIEILSDSSGTLTEYSYGPDASDENEEADDIAENTYPFTISGLGNGESRYVSGTLLDTIAAFDFSNRIRLQTFEGQSQATFLASYTYVR